MWIQADFSLVLLNRKYVQSPHLYIRNRIVHWVSHLHICSPVLCVNIKGCINSNGDSALRSQLYVAAFVSLRCNRECKACFDRLRFNGKLGIVTVVVVANKLIRQVFAVVNHEELYVDGFISSKL